MQIKSILFFAIPILIALAASETSTGIGHDEVLRKLNSLKENCRVSINGKAAPNSQEIVSVPKTIDSLPAHHSSPQNESTSISLTTRRAWCYRLQEIPVIQESTGSSSRNTELRLTTKLAGSRRLCSMLTNKAKKVFSARAPTSTRGGALPNLFNPRNPRLNSRI
jgi:hypothetical protein